VTDAGRHVRHCARPDEPTTLTDVGTSWLESVSGTTTRELTALRPDLAALIAELESNAAANVGERTQQLMAIRAAQMVGDPEFLAGADATLVEQATKWPTHPEVTEFERAALDVCESFIMDAHSVTDEQVVRLQRLAGDDGAVGVLLNLAVIDGFTKFRKVFTQGGR